jgi:hypothetical protein
MAADRHTAQHPAHVPTVLQSLRRRSGTPRIDDHPPHGRCHRCRMAIVEDRDQQDDVSPHARDGRLLHQGGRRPMNRSDNLITQLDAFRDHECPRFRLQRRRLSLGGIFAEGYEVTTTIRGVRFRFTAIVCYEGTTYGLVWATDGGRTLERLETSDRSLVTELFRPFAGFASAVTEAEPAIRDFGFRADPGDACRMRFSARAADGIARRWPATYVLRPYRYASEFRITLPENTRLTPTEERLGTGRQRSS